MAKSRGKMSDKGIEFAARSMFVKDGDDMLSLVLKRADGTPFAALSMFPRHWAELVADLGDQLHVMALEAGAITRQ